MRKKVGENDSELKKTGISCSKCGGEFVTDASKFTCTKCGYKIWPYGDTGFDMEQIRVVLLGGG